MAESRMVNRTSMSLQRRALLLTAGLTVGFCLTAYAAETRKEAKLDIAAGGTLNIVNAAGAVTLRSGAGHQAVVSYTLHSDKVEVDQNTSDNKQRVEFRTHALADARPTAEEARVDFEVTVPAGIAVNVTTTAAPITAENLSGDIGLSSETGQITVTGIAKSHLHVRSLSAPVNLKE